jgi:hypothetical protein
MDTMKQLAVFVANRPGTLAQICDTLAQNKVNILGISVADAMDHAVLRFVVDNAAVAVHILGETGLLVLDSDVLAIALDNQPGSLSDVSRALGEAGVNIEYAYGGTRQADRSGTLFLKVSDTDAARAALTRIGL